MTNIIVGVADMKVSDDRGSILITHSLGSCIGVAIYDPVVKVGGLLHYMLPESSLDGIKDKKILICLEILGSLFFLKSHINLA